MRRSSCWQQMHREIPPSRHLPVYRSNLSCLHLPWTKAPYNWSYRRNFRWQSPPGRVWFLMASPLWEQSTDCLIGKPHPLDPPKYPFPLRFLFDQYTILGEQKRKRHEMFLVGCKMDVVRRKNCNRWTTEFDARQSRKQTQLKATLR